MGCHDFGRRMKKSTGKERKIGLEVRMDAPSFAKLAIKGKRELQLTCPSTERTCHLSSTTCLLNFCMRCVQVISLYERRERKKIKKKRRILAKQKFNCSWNLRFIKCLVFCISFAITKQPTTPFKLPNAWNVVENQEKNSIHNNIFERRQCVCLGKFRGDDGSGYMHAPCFDLSPKPLFWRIIFAN